VFVQCKWEEGCRGGGGGGGGGIGGRRELMITVFVHTPNR